MKGVPFVNKRFTKGVPFRLKIVYKKACKGSDLSVKPLRKTLLSTPGSLVQ